MNLQETLQLVGLQIPVDPDALNKFADEDSIGGWDLGKGGWPIGSLWSVEGKALYALTRMFQPDLVVEIGTHRGCSTTHFATALDINGKGDIVSIDTAPGVGDLIPVNLLPRVTLVGVNGVDWLNGQPDESIDIIYEDADHSAETSRDVALLATRKLKPGGLHIVHDAAHDYAWLGDGSQVTSPVGETIRRGLDAALGNQYRVYRTDPSDCGFALWQKPGALKAQGLPGDDGYTRLQGDIHSTPIEQHSNPALAQAIAGAKEAAAANAPAGDQAALQTAENSAPEAEATLPKPLQEMSKAELEEYAEKHKISLSGARNNTDRVAKIVEAQARETSEA